MAKPSYYASYLPRLIREGYSPRQAADYLRERGHTFQDSTFRKAYAEVEDTLGRKGFSSAAPLRSKVKPTETGKATRPYARGPLARVQLLIHDPETKEVSFHVWDVRSKNQMSREWYLARAVEQWQDSQNRGRNTPPGRALGGMVTDVIMLVGEDEI